MWNGRYAECISVDDTIKRITKYNKVRRLYVCNYGMDIMKMKKK